MKAQVIFKIFLTCLFAFIGGAFSSQILGSNTARAAQEEIKEFFDISGIKRLDLGVYNNAGIMDIYGENGSPRLQFGTYTQPGEKGLPMAVFSDNNGHIKMLLRLAGANQSPVLIFKDSKGSDRMILGLALNDGSEDPFLTYTDSEGAHTLFGKANIAH